MFNKILIANRGEVACRLARTLRRMGINIATVHSSADVQALHVQDIGESIALGAAPARDSYLNIEAILEAARRVGADAIHPGFGFLSENAAFARACAAAGISFIGPSPETLVLFGDKAAAKQLAHSLGIPTAGGTLPRDNVDAVMASLESMGMPCIVKAVAGGGGKGMRVINRREEARDAIAAAIREGSSSFGDGRVIVECYLRHPRHIEVQILGDGNGQVIHLFDRECSLQRRHQKVVEEAPVSSLPEALRQRLWVYATSLGRAVSYLGLGTVEFAIAGDDVIFLEVNPRLQVEHPVTELILDADLVEWQVRAVYARCLPVTQSELAAPRGVAIQARLYAEDPAQEFLPSTGRIEQFCHGSHIRMDSGVTIGSEITSYYDPMVAKLIAHGETRGQALQQLRQALRETSILGVVNNRDFLMALLADPLVARNEITTETIDQWLAAHAKPAAPDAHIAALMMIWRETAISPDATQAGSWGDQNLAGWRLARGQSPQTSIVPRYEVRTAGQCWRVGFGEREATGSYKLSVADRIHVVECPTRLSDGQYLIAVNGESLRVQAICRAQQAWATLADTQLAIDIKPLYQSTGQSAAGGAGTVLAPMMGMLVGLHAKTGDNVRAGDKLATLESMKMEMPITAPVDGEVVWAGCALGNKVERNQEIFRINSITHGDHDVFSTPAR